MITALTQFGASLRFVELPAVAEFLATVAGTGRLRISSGEWVGEIVLRRGQMVAATLGDERGLAALESMALGFFDGELNFSDGPVAEDEPALLAAEEQHEYLQALNAERQRIMEMIDSLSLVPRLVDGPELGDFDDDARRYLTIDAAALQFIPFLGSGESIDRIARRRGLARTLRKVAALVRAEVVRLEEHEAAAGPAHAVPMRSVPARVLAARTGRAPVSIQPPRLYPQSALNSPYVRRMLVENDGPRRARLTGWSDALARILGRPQQGNGRAALFEPRYTYIRTQDPTLLG